MKFRNGRKAGLGGEVQAGTWSRPFRPAKPKHVSVIEFWTISFKTMEKKWNLLLLGSFFLEAKGRALLNRRRGEDAAAMQTEEW